MIFLLKMFKLIRMCVFLISGSSNPMQQLTCQYKKNRSLLEILYLNTLIKYLKSRTILYVHLKYMTYLRKTQIYSLWCIGSLNLKIQIQGKTLRAKQDSTKDSDHSKFLHFRIQIPTDHSPSTTGRKQIQINSVSNIPNHQPVLPRKSTRSRLTSDRLGEWDILLFFMPQNRVS